MPAVDIKKLAEEVEAYGRLDIGSQSSRRAGASTALAQLEAATGIPADSIWQAALAMPPAEKSTGSKLLDVAHSLALSTMVGQATFAPGMAEGPGIMGRLKGAARGFKNPQPAAAASTSSAAAAPAGMSKAAKLAIAVGTSGVALAGAKAAKDIYYDPWKEAKIEEKRDAPGGINEKKREEAARANALQMAITNADTERTMQQSALVERSKVEIAKMNSQAEIAKALIGMQQGPANAYADLAKTAAQQAAYLPKASVDIFDAISLSPAKDPRFGAIANAGTAAGSAPPNP